MTSRLRTRRAFTIIEAVAVLAVIAILTAIATPSVTSMLGGVSANQAKSSADGAMTASVTSYLSVSAAGTWTTTERDSTTVVAPPAPDLDPAALHVLNGSVTFEPATTASTGPAVASVGAALSADATFWRVGVAVFVPSGAGQCLIEVRDIDPPASSDQPAETYFSVTGSGVAGVCTGAHAAGAQLPAGSGTGVGTSWRTVASLSAAALG